MFRLRHWVALVLLGSQACCSIAAAALDRATREAVVERIVRTVHERYVFPQLAPRIEAALRDPALRSELERITDGDAFAARLTETLQAASKDKHLRVTHSPTPLPDDRANEPAPEAVAEQQRFSRFMNHGVARIERLPGNIGLLELTGFANVQWSGQTLSAAMTVLAHSDALIIDLRKNGGGDPAAVALVSSYLFDRRTHLNDLYFRPTDRTTQFWTQDLVPGLRYGGSKPVYVLTSSRTFSAAEEFSYNLRQLKRATLIGETTGGGAHPGELRKVGEHFRMFVSTGRAINPVSKTNWEGTGVEPHLPVKADDALRVAQLQALPPIIAATSDERTRQALQRRLAELEKTP